MFSIEKTCAIKTDGVNINENLLNIYDWEIDDKASNSIIINNMNSMIVKQMAYIESYNRYHLPNDNYPLILSCDCETISLSNSGAVCYLGTTGNMSRIGLQEVGYKQKIIVKWTSLPTDTELKFSGWGYSGVLKITNIKLEHGTIPTVWIPYNENGHGFFEGHNKASIYSGHITTNRLIEI